MPRRNAALVRATAAGARGKGRPPAGRREHRVRFWEAIARGASTVDASAEAGVLWSVGVRWFRKAGGMPPLTLAPVSGRYLSFEEREEIAVLLAGDCGVREIARQLGRAPSTISRELQRNAALRTGRPQYRASTAQTHADRRARRPKPAKRRSTRSCVAMCRTALPGLCSGPRGALRVRRSAGGGGVTDRERIGAGGQSWSPEQIAGRLRVDFPDDESMRDLSRSDLSVALCAGPRSAAPRADRVPADTAGRCGSRGPGRRAATGAS